MTSRTILHSTLGSLVTLTLILLHLRHGCAACARSRGTRHLLRELLQRVPKSARESDHLCKVAEGFACSKRYNVLQLIYQQQKFERGDKDYQFGRSTMRSHWDSGLNDIRRTLSNSAWLDLPNNQTGFVTHDIHRDGD